MRATVVGSSEVMREFNDILGGGPGDGFPVERLKFVSTFVTSGPRGWGQYYADDGAAFLRIGNVSRTRIDLLLSDIQRVQPPRSAEGVRTVVQAYDLLISITADIGSVGLVPPGLGEAYVNQHIALVRIDAAKAYPRFVAYAASSSLGRLHFDESMQGGTKVGLNLDDVRDMPFPAPPLPSQKAIANFLDRKTAAIDALIEKKQKLLELLAEKRAAVINQAVTKGLDPTVPMKDSGIPWIGEIPAHWELRRFKHIATVTNGQVDPTKPGLFNLPLYAPNHIEKGTGRLLQIESADEQGAISGKYLVAAGQLVYSKIRPALQKVFIAPQRGLCSADMYAIDVDAAIGAEFLKWWMLGDAFTIEAVQASERVAMPKVNRDTLADFVVPVPPTAEAKAIAQWLTDGTLRTEEEADKLSLSVARLQEYRQALITAAVTGQLDVPVSTES